MDKLEEYIRKKFKEILNGKEWKVYLDKNLYDFLNKVGYSPKKIIDDLDEHPWILWRNYLNVEFDFDKETITFYPKIKDFELLLRLIKNEIKDRVKYIT